MKIHHHHKRRKRSSIGSPIGIASIRPHSDKEKRHGFRRTPSIDLDKERVIWRRPLYDMVTQKEPTFIKYCELNE